MLRRTVLDMTSEEMVKSAYIKATVLDTTTAPNRDMKHLRAGNLNFNDADVNAEDATFRDNGATWRYIDAVPSARTSNTPWPVMRTGGTSLTKSLSQNKGS